MCIDTTCTHLYSVSSSTNLYYTSFKTSLCVPHLLILINIMFLILKKYVEGILPANLKNTML